ncbi:hypothetical protein OAQ87_00760 [Candidatus Marinimicrobia bacterium]|nr:hypothetical protein [Candidatus Neomarinimicrobiota bacterium]
MKKIFLINFILSSTLLFSECYQLSQSECLEYPQYCDWNDELNQCQDIGGGSTGGGTGGGSSDGPYDYATVTENDGLRNGSDYRDGVVYYPINADPPYKSIVLTPGFGGSSSEMSAWAEFYASHGFIAMRVGPNDEINDSHEDRGAGLLDGIESIRQENTRLESPLYNLIDMNSFSVSGYSMGGGASHNAAMIDENSIQTIISLNPTVLFEDCEFCPANTYEGVEYCICLAPELINHTVPSLIFAGEVEIDELSAYAGMLGQDIYTNMPESTDKIMFEGAGSGHGFAAYPNGEVSNYALNWLKYQVLNDDSACESLLITPSLASQYLTNFACEQTLPGDVNEDSIVNIQDIILAVNLVLTSQYNSSADLNYDDTVNVLDIIGLVNLILN